MTDTQTEQRAHAVPCVYATPEQVRCRRHMTWAVDRVCDDCREATT